MSAGPVQSSGGGRGKASQDFDLNLAPIIDCFTVLITFMLASAAFLSIGLLDAGVAAAGAAPKDGTPPPINIVVELSKSQQIAVKVTGKLNTTQSFAAIQGEWDFEGLTRHLSAVKQKFPDVSAATLSAEVSVEYKDVIKAMEVTRKTLPAVLLGGF